MKGSGKNALRLSKVLKVRKLNFKISSLFLCRMKEKDKKSKIQFLEYKNSIFLSCAGIYKVWSKLVPYQMIFIQEPRYFHFIAGFNLNKMN